MLIESYRLLVIPLCAVAVAASAVSAPFDMLVSLIAVLGIALMGFPRWATATRTPVTHGLEHSNV
jgi:hypothetical protein